MEPWKQVEMAYEETLAESYDFHYYSRPIPRFHLRDFCKLVKRYAGRKDLILDLGGGTGVVSERLWEMGFRRVVIADLSLQMIKQAKQKKGGQLAVVCDAEQLPFKDETFDTIVSSSVLHHLPFPALVLQEIRRAVALYGVVIAQEPNKKPFLIQPEGAQVGDRAMSLMHYLYRIERYRPVLEPPVHEYHRAFTREELSNLFLKHFFVLEFQSRFAFSYVFEKLRSGVMARFIQAFDQCFRDHEGSVLYFVCSKTDAGHRQMLTDYFWWVRKIPQDTPQTLPTLFVLGLFPLIMLAKAYEVYLRLSTKCRRLFLRQS